MFTLDSLNAIAATAVAKVSARASRPERQPRKAGLHARFIADLLATAGDNAISVPLSPAVDAWIAHQREQGGDLGSGATPEASISARLYCDAKAGKLPARVTLQAGRPALLVVASATAPEATPALDDTPAPEVVQARNEAITSAEAQEEEVAPRRSRRHA